MPNGILAKSSDSILTHAMTATWRIAVAELTSTPALERPSHMPKARSSLTSPACLLANCATLDQKPMRFSLRLLENQEAATVAVEVIVTHQRAPDRHDN